MESYKFFLINHTRIIYFAIDSITQGYPARSPSKNNPSAFKLAIIITIRYIYRKILHRLADFHSRARPPPNLLSSACIYICIYINLYSLLHAKPGPFVILINNSIIYARARGKRENLITRLIPRRRLARRDVYDVRHNYGDNSGLERGEKERERKQSRRLSLSQRRKKREEGKVSLSLETRNALTLFYTKS